MEKPKRKPLEEMTDEEKYQMFIDYMIELYDKRYPNIITGTIYQISDVQTDVKIWIGMSFGEYNFLVGAGKRNTGRFISCYLKRGDTSEEGKYYLQVSVEEAETDELITAFLMFGSREEVMQRLQEENVEEDIFWKIMELSERRNV